MMDPPYSNELLVFFLQIMSSIKRESFEFNDYYQLISPFIGNFKI